jgi:hypothetical protein
VCPPGRSPRPASLRSGRSAGEELDVDLAVGGVGVAEVRSDQARGRSVQEPLEGWVDGPDDAVVVDHDHRIEVAVDHAADAVLPDGSCVRAGVLGRGRSEEITLEG